MFEPEDMSDTEAVTAAKPGEPRYLPWLSIFVLWALVQVVVVAVGASPVFEGGLIGTDGYMRLGAAVLTGVVLGIGLWVSVEFLLVVLLAAAVLWLSWLRGGAAKAAPAVGLALGLAGSVAIALLIERPIEAVLIEEHDRISIVHQTLVLVHLSFWALVVLGERATGVSLSLRGRLVCSLLGALAGGALLLAVYPKFFGRRHGRCGSRSRSALPGQN